MHQVEVIGNSLLQTKLTDWKGCCKQEFKGQRKENLKHSKPVAESWLAATKQRKDRGYRKSDKNQSSTETGKRKTVKGNTLLNFSVSSPERSEGRTERRWHMDKTWSQFIHFLPQCYSKMWLTSFFWVVSFSISSWARVAKVALGRKSWLRVSFLIKPVLLIWN